MAAKRFDEKATVAANKAKEKATPDPVASAQAVQAAMASMASPTKERVDVSAPSNIPDVSVQAPVDVSEPRNILEDIKVRANDLYNHGVPATNDFDVLSKYTVDIYHEAQVYGKASMAVNWRAGQALTRVYKWFKERKDIVKQNGGKLYDEPLTWSSWLKLHNIPRNSAGRYMALYEKYTIDEVRDKLMLDLEGVDDLHKVLEPGVAFGDYLRSTCGMELKDEDKNPIRLPEATCFKILSISPKSMGVEIKTGIHKGKKSRIEASRAGYLITIAPGDVKEPVQEPDTSVKAPAPGEPTPPPAPAPGEPKEDFKSVRYKVVLEIILEFNEARGDDIMDEDEVKEYVYEVMEQSPFDEVSITRLECLPVTD